MSGRALVVTVGQSRHESLGALKLAAWLRSEGWSVVESCTISPFFDSGYDLYAFSAVFSWWLPTLVECVNVAKRWGEVWIGGPAVTFHADNARYVERETGVKPTLGIDDRFERQVGAYPMVYFSRGCPAYTKACGHCPVVQIEGRTFRYYRDAVPAPLLLDNNLSALPDDYQDFIIRRYREDWKGRGHVDANSGFEPHSFTEDTLLRWKAFPLAFWRFGYDDLSERDQSLEMMSLLGRHGLRGKKVRVYTLIGNEPIQSCLQRVREVIDRGCYPWPQRLRLLNWLGGPLPCLYDWDEPTLIAFQRFYSIARLWKTVEPSDFWYQGRYPLRFGRTT